MMDEFWQRFLEFRERQPNRRRRNLFDPPVCAQAEVAGDTVEEAEHLLQLVIDGERRADIRSLYTWQDSGLPIPGAEVYSALLDVDGRPRCVLRSGGSHIVPFRSVPEELAMLEGLDMTFRDWQLRSRARFLQESKDRGIVFSLDMPLVVSTFEVAYWEE